MNWTKEKPKNPGVYWYRDAETINRNSVDTVAEIKQLAIGALLVVQMTNGWHGSLMGFDGEWFGPIEKEYGMDCSLWDSRCVQLDGKLLKLQQQYSELILAVGKKYPGESRHETALRYIRQAETPESTSVQGQKGDK